MKFLRYPGGKARLLKYIAQHLPTDREVKGKYVEPFVGGGSVFFHHRPSSALLCDLNDELIELYKGISLYPHKVWETYESFPVGKEAYYQVRDSTLARQPLYFRAARTLFLNRTCFKGMWRHNPSGKFNVGYGGEDRRWVINHENIVQISRILRHADIRRASYEETLSNVRAGDFLFLDPPYKPGEKDLVEGHYSNGKFSYEEQVTLATHLKELSKRKRIKWLMTNSSHSAIRKLYSEFKIKRIPIGTGDSPGIPSKKSNEVLISNF